MPAIPSCTVAGVLGIARITGTFAGRCFSIDAVRTAATTERIVCSLEIRSPISCKSPGRSWGLTAITISAASFRIAVRLARLDTAELLDRLQALAMDVGGDDLARLTPARGAQALDQRFANLAGANDRYAALVNAHRAESIRRSARKASSCSRSRTHSASTRLDVHDTATEWDQALAQSP